MGIPVDDLFVEIKGGVITEIRGTYIHPKLAPHIASWINPKVAIIVADIVNNY